MQRMQVESRPKRGGCIAERSESKERDSGGLRPLQPSRHRKARAAAPSEMGACWMAPGKDWPGLACALRGFFMVPRAGTPWMTVRGVHCRTPSPPFGLAPV